MYLQNQAGSEDCAQFTSLDHIGNSEGVESNNHSSSQELHDYLMFEPYLIYSDTLPFRVVGLHCKFTENQPFRQSF